MDGELAPMKEVIAVFAVRANAEGDELMTMDEAKKDQFLLVFWGMNTIRAYTEEKIKIETVYETDADGNTVEVQREKIEVYYVLSYDSRYDKVTTYRVDRMERIETKEDEPISEQAKEKINVGEYTEQTFKIPAVEPL